MRVVEEYTAVNGSCPVGTSIGNRVRSDERVGARFQQTQNIPAARDPLSTPEFYLNRRVPEVTPP